ATRTRSAQGAPNLLIPPLDMLAPATAAAARAAVEMSCWRRAARPAAAVRCVPPLPPRRAFVSPALAAAVAADRTALAGLLARLAEAGRLQPEALQAAVASVHDAAAFRDVLDVVHRCVRRGAALGALELRLLAIGCGRWGSLADALA